MMKTWTCPTCKMMVGEDEPRKANGQLVYHVPCFPESVYDDSMSLLGTLSAESKPTCGDQRYLDILTELADLHKKKAADYGRGDDPLANVRASEELGIPAWKGSFLRALDKVHRIKSYCLNGKLENEGVEDSLKDLAAYALIALVLFREHEQRSK